MSAEITSGAQDGVAEAGLTSARWRVSAALGRYKGVLSVLILLIVVFSATQSAFATTSNFTNILDASSVLLVVSVGLTFPMLAGGFDLSVAGVDALVGVLLAKLMLSVGMAFIPAMLIVIAGAVLLGALVNGLLIGYFNVDFFIVTLGTLTIAQGLALEFTGGNTITLYKSQVLHTIGTGQVGPFPVDGLIAIGILLVAILVLRYTGFGRMVYAVGGNREASRISGIHVSRITLATYAISAGLAALGGVIEVGRLASAGPTTDSTIELTAAAAVLVGGTMFGGGVGTMLGTLLGVAFLGVLQDGLLISGVSAYWQGVITGVVLIASVSIDRMRRAERRGQPLRRRLLPKSRGAPMDGNLGSSSVREMQRP